MLVMAHDEHGYGDVDNHGDHDGYIVTLMTIDQGDQ